MESHTYVEADMDDAEQLGLAGGTCHVYSSRCPGKLTANEDAAAVIAIDERSAVVVLADGMGGASAGHHASRIAVQTLQESVESAASDSTLLRSAILNGIEQANQAIIQLGVGAATTLAVVEIQGDEIRPYHVGDSEILLVGSHGKIKLQTMSHSPVGYAIEAGVLDQTEAMHHEERHFISNSVGSTDMRIEIGSPIKMARRDTLLLSSDGLTDNLHSDEIVSCVRKGPVPAAIRKLANDSRSRMTEPTAGLPSKPDDLTVIVFRR